MEGFKVMEKIKLVRTNGKRPLVFEGELITKVKETTFFWTFTEEYFVYKTKQGKYICVQEVYRWMLVLWDHILNVSGMYDSLDDIVDYFGQGDLSDKLYEKLGIKNEEEVD